MKAGLLDCDFCEIVRRDDPDAREVYRDRYSIAFFPTEPAVLGHTLVIPRAHVADIWSLSENQARILSVTSLKLAHVIRTAVNPDGMNIIQSNGAAASQTVPHLHVHIVPRWHNDRIGRIWPPESSYSETQKDDAWRRIRDGCRMLTGDR